MSSRLKAVAPKSAAPSKPKVLIYGKAGVGKTWVSMDWPSCFFVDTEGGANLPHYVERLERSGGVYLGPDQGSTDFAAIIDQVKALATERHPYRTLVIDSITKIFALEIAREAERLGDKDAFGASKKPAVSYMRQLIAALMRVDMNVLLVAHEIEQWGSNERGERAVIGATFDAWPKLEYELHLALHVTKQGPSRYAQVRKSRLLGFPEGTRFPWSYDEFAERYGRDVIEKAVKPVELATPEQIAEAEHLLDTVKMPDAWLERCLSSANVDALAELDTDRIDKLINAMKERTRS